MVDTEWFIQVIPLIPAILRERAHLPDDQRTSMPHHAATPTDRTSPEMDVYPSRSLWQRRSDRFP